MSDDHANETLREARAAYFEANGLGADGGYSRKWVTGKAGFLPFAFPNTQSRVRAVRYHDLHHLLTGYETHFTGEAEISAWEIASGCADKSAAWGLNMWGMFTGLLFDAGAVFRAFVRGRHTRNLYRLELDDALLAATLGETRAKLDLDARAPEPTPRDRLAFAGWISLAGIWTLATLAALLGPLVGAAYWLLAG